MNFGGACEGYIAAEPLNVVTEMSTSCNHFFEERKQGRRFLSGSLRQESAIHRLIPMFVAGRNHICHRAVRDLSTGTVG